MRAVHNVCVHVRKKGEVVWVQLGPGCPLSPCVSSSPCSCMSLTHTWVLAKLKLLQLMAVPLRYPICTVRSGQGDKIWSGICLSGDIRKEFKGGGGSDANTHRLMLRLDRWITKTLVNEWQQGRH